MKDLPSGSKVANMRLATNTRRKDGATGEWVDKPNYFDVAAFGNVADTCGRYLAKGSAIMVTGRLDWREWETQEGGKRQTVQIVAENIEFIGKKPDGDGGGGGEFTPRSDVPVDDADFKTAAPVGPDDDIPF